MSFSSTHGEVTSFARLIVFVSYEDRSMTLLRHASELHFDGEVVAFYCQDANVPATNENIKEARELFGSRIVTIPVSITNPVRMIDAISGNDWRQDRLVDLSCFNRSNLFAFLWALDALQEDWPRTCFAYTPPVSYGSWLSRDYEPAANYIGFSGYRTTRSRRHLVVCVGYEAARAVEAIRAVEPSTLTLALGNQPTAEEFLKRNKETLDEIVSNLLEFRVESIDVTDPEICRAQLGSLLEKSADDESRHVAPLSTKLSCLATFSVTLEDPFVRVWGVGAKSYNVKNYSAGSRDTSFFEAVRR